MLLNQEKESIGLRKWWIWETEYWWLECNIVKEYSLV